MVVLAGDKVLASQWSDHESRIANLEDRVGCRLRRAANQSINTATVTAMSWDTEEEDTDAFITVTSATITIPAGKDGRYDITFQAGGATSSTRLLAIIAVTSSVSTYPAEFRNETTGQELNVMIAVTGIDLAVGDSFQAKVFHNSGAAVNFTGWLSCYRRAGTT